MSTMLGEEMLGVVRRLTRTRAWLMFWRSKLPRKSKAKQHRNIRNLFLLCRRWPICGANSDKDDSDMETKSGDEASEDGDISEDAEESKKENVNPRKISENNLLGGGPEELLVATARRQRPRGR